MTNRKKNDEQKHAYEHVLRSLLSIGDILRDCCNDIDDIELDSSTNVRALDRILGWIYETSNEIKGLYPDLAPGKDEPIPRRWPADPKRTPRREPTREEALRRLRHELELARLILQEAGPFASELGIPTADLAESIDTVKRIYAAATRETWKDLSDQQKRLRIRDWGIPDGVTEPPPPDRDAALNRLNEKLDVAAKVLDDCAQLIADTELDAPVHLRGIGNCLATIFDIHTQIYRERPDLTPQFLKNRETE